MNVSTKEKQAHRHREQACGCQGGGVLGGRWIERLGLAYASYYV